MEEKINEEKIESSENETVAKEEKPHENKKKSTKKIKMRTCIVLAILLIFIIGGAIVYRAEYLKTLEIGAEYLEVWKQNIKYKIGIGVANFVAIFFMVWFTNYLIKKGLKQFFEQEKKDMPKLPNKSLAFIIALVTSLIVSNLFLHKVILFMNAAQFGIPEPVYNTDIGFYMFQAPLIGQLLYYGATMLILLTVYIVAYYLIVFNTHFDGIDGTTLRQNTFIKQILCNVMLITVFAALIILFNMQNIMTGSFLTLDNREGTALIGSGLTDNIKIWGYRILSVIMIISVWIAIKAFKKKNTKKIITSLAVVPTYLIGLFVVLFGYHLFFVRGSELDKQKSYITTNIEFTKTAYDINTNEETLEHVETLTEEVANRNQEVINNVPIITEDMAMNHLLQTQTSTGYYTYHKAKATLYQDKLTYLAARELDTRNDTDEYTHGYGAVITAASETDEAGNVKYIARDFENQDIIEPRIYYGMGNTKLAVVQGGKEEFDYPKTSKNHEVYTYQGTGGLTLGLLDRICMGAEQGKPGLVLASSDSKILFNTNILKRAEQILPYVMYDENPYLVLSEDGELYWIIDAYTISNDYPYSQKTKMVYKKETREINYIRNSIKVIVNAFNGDTTFYMMDKTDPIAMVYHSMYPNLFQNGEEIPKTISKYFTYPEFLYQIQSEMLEKYHNVSADVLYRSNDVWEIASYSNLLTKSGGAKMKPIFTMTKGANEEESKLGLVIAYNQYGKESLNAYLIGTVENGKNQLSLYKYSGDSTILGPMQLDSLIQQDETISSEIASLSVTGTKISKEMLIVPIENTILYAVPIYQTSLNETNSVPVLKKVVVASGNKVAIGDNLTKAVRNLLSPNGAVRIEVEDNSTIEGLVDLIIKANHNLNESNGSNDWGQMGRDIEALQALIKQLEAARDSEKQNNNHSNGSQATENESPAVSDGNTMR